MSLFLAQLLVGLALLLLGGALVADTTLIRAGLRALPRSAPAAYVLFGAAAAWFVLLVLNMSDADLIVPAPKSYYAAAFALLAVLAFFNDDPFWSHFDHVRQGLNHIINSSQQSNFLIVENQYIHQFERFF
jgi:hypothetical protein